MKTRKRKFTLHDQGEVAAKRTGWIEACQTGLWLHLDGCEDAVSIDPCESIQVAIELLDGVLHVVVWADSSNEEPTHRISLQERTV
jgi:hypothetical protein